ncbi:MAG: hypothetical protein IJX53_06740 [Clostridia bacterium]|nr:hypothetical protein [Clostridia bacterium]
MRERTFTALLIALAALGVVLTAAHLVYAVYAYQHCSIIYFIAEELW